MIGKNIVFAKWQRLLASAALAALAAPQPAAAFAGQEEGAATIRPDLAAALPADVVSALASAQNVRTIFPVNGTESFDGQILKADEIVFAPDSRLVLTAVDKPWVAIVARKMKFADPDSWTRIQRPPLLVAPKGQAGAAGARGRDDPGETGRTGNPGGHGGAGQAGGDGATRPLPHIYLIAEDFQTPEGQPLPGYMRLGFDLRGVDGGDGGEGGRGGDGGNAGNGKKGAMGVIDCREGGGPGGRGGNAGRGGRGGNGGIGGNGADLTYVSTRDGVELLSYARIVNIGGAGGQGGYPGRAGNPGRGGAGAGRNGLCRPTAPGSDGDRPTPRDLGPGTDGADGRKGVVTAFTVSSLAPVFP